MRKICLASISIKPSEYFFKKLHTLVNFLQDHEKIFSNCSKYSSNSFPKYFQNFLKLFLQISLLKLLRTCQLEFRQCEDDA